MQDCKEADIVVLTTTVGSAADGQRLARAIMADQLAACVQLEPGLTSFYRWDGQLCEAPECRLVIKTLPHCLPQLQALFARAHPYSLPQWVAHTGRASAAYGGWVRSEVRSPPG